MLEKALKEAETRKADVFLMRLNTFGGALDAAGKKCGLPCWKHRLRPLLLSIIRLPRQVLLFLWRVTVL
ncbi:MAG: hypothetical protein ACOXZJ_05475 [Bacteroidales bacterium]